MKTDSDITMLEEQIKLHESSIKYLKEEIDKLLLAKLEKLLKETPEHRLYVWNRDCFCLENGNPVYVDQQGNHLPVTKHLTSLLTNHVPHTVYKLIREVELE